MQSRNLVAHVASTASRTRDADRRNDEDLVGQAEVAHHRHEPGEERHVEDQLGLNEIGAGPDFLLEPERAEFQRRREGILDGANEEGRGLFELSPAQIDTAVAHTRGDLDELHRIDVIDPASFGMIAGGHIVAAHQHDVADAERRGTQQVRLQGEPVPVADRQLHDGLDPFLHQQVGRGQRRHVDVRAGVVGAVDGVDISAERARLPLDTRRGRIARRFQLSRQHKSA